MSEKGKIKLVYKNGQAVASGLRQVVIEDDGTIRMMTDNKETNAADWSVIYAAVEEVENTPPVAEAGAHTFGDT